MIHVCWHEGTDGFTKLNGRSGYSCCTMLNEMFDRYDCTHWSTFPNVPADVDGCVIVIQGGNERNRVAEINQDASRLKWVLFITIGDEGSDFPVEQLKHPHSKVWVQMAQPGGVRMGDRNYIDGYSRDTPRLANKQQHKILDWFFAGQNTHIRRHQCITVLKTLTRGVLVETKGFMQGLSLDEYFYYMKMAKVVPCPSGPATPDTMRMAEALECGAVPIIDNRNPRYVETGYWEMVFGADMPPFPIVDEWNTLPEVMTTVLTNWNALSLESQAWWERYQFRFRGWLQEDLQWLTQ